jgi:protein-S-isoprenylcysteine O-methyltransferase Ste14
MTERLAILIFGFSWIFLVIAAILAQIIFEDKHKRNAGIIINLLVFTPFVGTIVIFYLKDFVGSYESTFGTMISGIIILALGMIGYIASHYYLRRNWSISASIKEGHTLIKKGPYKIVRHPMYSSMVLIVFGSGLLIADFLLLLFAPLVFIIYYVRATVEEKLLKDEFPEYESYSKITKMLIPGIL